jgi:hypothetical protein
MSVPDPIERGEATMELWADSHIDGDKWLCDCGKWRDISDMHPSSPNPYSPPICGECAFGANPEVDGT